MNIKSINDLYLAPMTAITLAIVTIVYGMNAVGTNEEVIQVRDRVGVLSSNYEDLSKKVSNNAKLRYDVKNLLDLNRQLSEETSRLTREVRKLREYQEEG